MIHLSHETRQGVAGIVTLVYGTLGILACGGEAQAPTPNHTDGAVAGAVDEAAAGAPQVTFEGTEIPMTDYTMSEALDAARQNPDTPEYMQGGFVNVFANLDETATPQDVVDAMNASLMALVYTEDADVAGQYLNNMFAPGSENTRGYNHFYEALMGAGPKIVGSDKRLPSLRADQQDTLGQTADDRANMGFNQEELVSAASNWYRGFVEADPSKGNTPISSFFYIDKSGALAFVFQTNSDGTVAGEFTGTGGDLRFKLSG